MLKEFMILSADIYHFRSDLLHIGPHRLDTEVDDVESDGFSLDDAEDKKKMLYKEFLDEVMAVYDPLMVCGKKCKRCLARCNKKTKLLIHFCKRRCPKHG